MSKVMIGFKADKEFKEILQKAAQDERRTLSNFIKNALLEYLKDKHQVEYQEKP
jgi:uncharacterized protein (DUF1778 family)